jgi:hypothetical protein
MIYMFDFPILISSSISITFWLPPIAITHTSNHIKICCALTSTHGNINQLRILMIIDHLLFFVIHLKKPTVANLGMKLVFHCRILVTARASSVMLRLSPTEGMIYSLFCVVYSKMGKIEL